MGLLERFLNFWAGADNLLLGWCPHHETQKYATLGILVLMTGIFASLASGYAFFTIFESARVAVILGLLWGFLIINIDRLLLATFPKTKNSVRQFLHSLPRFILALFIGMTIAHPLSLRLFEPEITSAIIDENDHKRVDKERERVAARQEAEAEKQRRINNLPQFVVLEQRRNDLADITAALKVCDEGHEAAAKDALREADGSGGSLRRGLGPNYRAKKDLADKLEAKCQNLRTKLATSRASLDIAEQDFLLAATDIKHWRDAAELEIEASFKIAIAHLALQRASFLKRSEMLGSISDQRRHAASTRLAVSLLFILVEVIPVFVKIISPRDSVDLLAEAISADFAANRIKDLVPRLTAIGTLPAVVHEPESVYKVMATGNPTKKAPAAPGSSFTGLVVLVIATVCVTVAMVLTGSAKGEASEAGALFLAMAIPFWQLKRRSVRD